MPEHENKPKKEGRVSKLLLGVIVGGAVGSVLGVTLADEKRREKIKEKSIEAFEKSRIFFDEHIADKISKKDKKTGFWHYLHRVFHGEKK